MSGRLSYEQSLTHLRALGLLAEDEHPPLPSRMPRYDDEEPLGVNLFRMAVEDVALSGLTLPRTFAGRSSFERVVFANSDFSQSNFCWNDFIGCDFTGADLSESDLRASIYQQVNFESANLSGCDLRRATLEGCRFGGAQMRGAVLTRGQGEALGLDPRQRADIAWVDDAGPEPDGG